MNKLKCKKCNKVDNLVCSVLNGFCSDCFRSNIKKDYEKFKQSINNIKTK